MGDFQREIAKEKGISIVELGELEKTDPSIDKMVDDMQKKLGQKDNFVIDAWLAAFFIPDSIKIFLDADVKQRAKRLMENREAEHYKTLKDAMNAMQQREETNRIRWKKFYGFDFMDKKNYNFFFDTTGKKSKDMVEIVYTKIMK